MSYLGARLLMIHIDQFLVGNSRDGMPGVPDHLGLADFFKRHHVRPADVVEALQATGRGDAETVRQYVDEHSELAEWYSVPPPLAPKPGPT
jgi:hypothetical protein